MINCVHLGCERLFPMVTYEFTSRFHGQNQKVSELVKMNMKLFSVVFFSLVLFTFI